MSEVNPTEKEGKRFARPHSPALECKVHRPILPNGGIMFRAKGVASWRGILGLVLLGVAGATWLGVATRAHAGASAGACPWKVKTVRDPSSDEASVEKSLPYPPLDPDRNQVPGPGAMKLVARRDSDQHPTVYLESAAGGDTKPLVSGWSYLPSWSPSGELAACLMWKSDRRSDLAIVE